MKEITVTINASHLGGCYINGGDCALHRALKEQHNYISFISEGMYGIADSGNIVVYTNFSIISPLEGSTKWNSTVHGKLLSGKISSVTLTYLIPEEYINHSI